MKLDLHHLSKHFGDFAALTDVSLKVNSGELVALLGPSGCGKTTLLRIIAGLETADAGSLMFGGQDATQVPARDRRVGFVFQNYALFPHLSVFENIAFGLRVRPRAQRPDAAAISRRVNELLALVQLDDVGARLPAQLSGGQRQRIALARALAVDPSVLLLDEPFGALDAGVRKSLRRWLRRLHDELSVTSLFVTHDQDEALEVADRVVVMDRGRIEQYATPQQLRAEPATPFVCGFLGDANRFDGRSRSGRIDLDGFVIDSPAHRDVADAAAIAYVQPNDIDVERPAIGDSSRFGGTRRADGITARLHRIVPLGSFARLELERTGDQEPIEVRLPISQVDALAPTAGETLLLRPRRLKVFVDGFTHDGALPVITSGAADAGPALAR